MASNGPSFLTDDTYPITRALGLCWNIWIDDREDCITVLCGHKISLYTGGPSGQRTEDCPPRRCSGTQSCPDATSGPSCPDATSGPSCPDATSGPSSPDAYYSDTSPRTEDAKKHRRERNKILGCLVKTCNRVKNPLKGKPRT